MTPRDDPRLADEYVRRHAGSDGDGDVCLVGVLHDHPASVYRVQTLAERESPDVLALELPPLAVPLFERYATDERAPPAFGGEMSAAIQAAATERVVGIDGPSKEFLRRLARHLAGDASVETVRKTVRSVLSAGREAIACRLAAAVDAHTSMRVEVDPPSTYDVSRADDPARQAEDERREIGRSSAVMELFETPPSARCRTEAREAHMADRIAALRAEGDVLAVVGAGHLDPLSGEFSGTA